MIFHQQMYLFDLTATDGYDLHTPNGINNAWAEVHVTSALQGIVNRSRPCLYLIYVTDDRKQPGKIDRFWLDHLRRPNGGWLERERIDAVQTLEALVEVFRKEIKGVVLYDLAVPATSNVASTVAGCDDLVPVPYDPTPGSVYSRLVTGGPSLHVRVRLIQEDGTPRFTGAETGSAKCDAYLWAKRNYLDTRKCNPAKMGYYLDSWWRTLPTRSAPNTHGLSNQDYFVANRAFFFDLSPWEDELPQDDTKQPLGTDFRTLIALLKSAYDATRGKSMIHVGGFVPWAWKYTKTAGGNHGDVASEWRYAAILSCFNAFMDADALGLNAMANASVFQHAPLRKHCPQTRPGPADWQAAGYLNADKAVTPRTYISFYVGDYDSAAWLYQRLPGLWQDPARGKIPLGWAFNPNLSDRFAVGMDWARTTATPNDHFIAGDSGAGYLNPGFLDGDRRFSHLPSGLAVWEKHCTGTYRTWDIGITGFVIDGDARPMSPAALAAYARFSPEGFAAQKLPAAQGLVPGTRTPFLRMGDDMPDGHRTDEAVARIKARLERDSGAGPHFHLFRTILWTPTQHQALFARLREMSGVAVVDPYTLFGLLRSQLGA